jgi:formylglycine-generating enzyme required for sulfatase activity
VASWPANPFGLFDTASNVREWTCSAAAAFGEGSELRCAAEDAPGERAVRGGSWTDGPNALRSAERAFLEGNRRDVHTGFRIVSDAGGGVP